MPSWISTRFWFFKCHFPGDPVMPGCLGLDAMGRRSAFSWHGSAIPVTAGRFGVGEVKFTGQVLPSASMVTYRLDMKRVISRKLVLGVADGVVKSTAGDLHSQRSARGLFANTDSF